MCEVGMHERTPRFNKPVSGVMDHSKDLPKQEIKSNALEIIKEIFRHPYLILTSVIWISCGIACWGTHNDSPLFCAFVVSFALYVTKIGFKVKFK